MLVGVQQSAFVDRLIISSRVLRRPPRRARPCRLAAQLPALMGNTACHAAKPVGNLCAYVSLRLNRWMLVCVEQLPLNFLQLIQMFENGVGHIFSDVAEIIVRIVKGFAKGVRYDFDKPVT